MELLLHINSGGQAFCRTLSILMLRLEPSFPVVLLTANVRCLVPWEPVSRHRVSHSFPPAQHPTIRIKQRIIQVVPNTKLRSLHSPTHGGGMLDKANSATRNTDLMSRKCSPRVCLGGSWHPNTSPTVDKAIFPVQSCPSALCLWNKNSPCHWTQKIYLRDEVALKHHPCSN